MIEIGELDVIYISYDEPHKEYNWADLLNKCPWAKRVDRVKGFDAAHKAAANLSETDHFITVDGDNIVDVNFFDLTLPLELDDTIYSWRGRNELNGLIYGNGGLKIWPKHVVEKMSTHETSKTDRLSVEFCWGLKYVQLRECWSDVIVNGSPLQAFRVGFREGVKLSMVNGLPYDGKMHEWRSRCWEGNVHRLQIWSTVGSHKENGLWAIFGARLGWWSSLIGKFDHSVIRDYEWFDHVFEGINVISDENFGEGSRQLNGMSLEEKIIWLGNELGNYFSLKLPLLDEKASDFFQSVMAVPLKHGDAAAES